MVCFCVHYYFPQKGQEKGRDPFSLLKRGFLVGYLESRKREREAIWVGMGPQVGWKGKKEGKKEGRSHYSTIHPSWLPNGPEEEEKKYSQTQICVTPFTVSLLYPLVMNMLKMRLIKCQKARFDCTSNVRNAGVGR